MLLPKGRLLEQHDGVGRKIFLRKVPTLELPCVDPMGVSAASARGESAGVLAVQNIEHEIGGLGAYRLEGNHVSTHNSPAEEGVVRTIDGGIGGGGDFLGDIERHEVPTGAVPENRKENDDGVAR